MFDCIIRLPRTSLPKLVLVVFVIGRCLPYGFSSGLSLLIWTWPKDLSSHSVFSFLLCSDFSFYCTFGVFRPSASWPLDSSISSSSWVVSYFTFSVMDTQDKFSSTLMFQCISPLIELWLFLLYFCLYFGFHRVHELWTITSFSMYSDGQDQYLRWGI